PRPLASLRQKTLPHNNSRLRDSGEVGSRNSRLTVYPACPIDATRPSNDTFSACYRFFASWGGLKRHPSFPLQMTLRRNTDRSATALARWWCHGGRRSDRRRGPDAPAGNGHTKAAQTMALTCTTGSRGENPGSAGALAVFPAGSWARSCTVFFARQIAGVPATDSS